MGLGGDPDHLRLQGRGHLRVDLPDDGCRPAGRSRSAQPAVPPHPRPVGGLLQAADERPAHVAHHERRRPDPARRLRNRGRPAARVAGARRLRERAVLLRRAAGARLPHRRAADHLPAGAGGPAHPEHDAAEPGGPRAHLASERRVVHRPPDREGLRRRGQGGRSLPDGLGAALSHQHERDQRAGVAAAAHGAAGRRGDHRRDLVRQPQDRLRRAHARRSSRRSSPPRS